MSALCSCGVSLQNTGTPNCIPVFGVTKQLILVPLIANDGTENSIDPTDTLDSAYVTALINQADDSKRWYPVGPLKNVAGERADALMETFEDGSKVFIRQGVRSFTGLVLKGGPELLNQLNSNRCSSFGAYMIDSNGSLYGKVKNDDGMLYPVEIQADSFYNKLMFTTDTTIQKIMISFEFGIDEKDEDLRMILSSSFTGVNLANVKGLINTYYKGVAIGTTSIVVDIFNKYGDFVNGSPVEGLQTADFVSSDSATTGKVYDITDNSDVTISSVAESTTQLGRYTLSMSSGITVGDDLQILVKKNGLDGSTMLGTIVTAV
jgi:hypothetical protein